MTSEAIRDPLKDHLLTPQNSALIIIDYQPIQVSSIRSMDQKELVFNIVHTAKAAINYRLPIVHSTVNVATGKNKPPIQPLMDVLRSYPIFDRTSINSWEDVEFKEAVVAIGRKKLIMAALWTEACLAFPALDALKEGYEVYAVADAVGGTSVAAHEAALHRIEQAGGKLISKTQLYCELQRDWNRAVVGLGEHESGSTIVRFCHRDLGVGRNRWIGSAQSTKRRGNRPDRTSKHNDRRTH